MKEKRESPFGFLIMFLVWTAVVYVIEAYAKPAEPWQETMLVALWTLYTLLFYNPLLAKLAVLRHLERERKEKPPLTIFKTTEELNRETDKIL